MTAAPNIVAAHHHSLRHRDAVLASDACGCFYCCRSFSPLEIVEWTDRGPGGVQQTALRPFCGIDSVIGSDSGYPVTPAFLRAMHDHWFGTP